MRLLRLAVESQYRPSQTMNFYVEPAQGHDNFLMILALLVEAAKSVYPAGGAGKSAEYLVLPPTFAECLECTERKNPQAMTIKACEFDRLISKFKFKTRNSRDLLAWFEH